MLKFSCYGDSSQPSVLFLHGAGVSSWMWQDVMSHLSKVQCVLVDLPGHGENRNIPWKSIADTAKRVHEVALLQRNNQIIHIAGVSLGSYVGLELMRQQPAYYSTALLSGMHAQKMPYKYLMQMMAFVSSPFITSSFFARRTAKSLGCRTENIDNFVKEAVKTNARSLSQASIDVINFVLPPLSDVQSNVLFAAGDKEHPVIKASLTTLADSLPNGKYKLISRAGHGWPGVFPEKFAAMLMQQMNNTGC